MQRHPIGLRFLCGFDEASASFTRMFDHRGDRIGAMQVDEPLEVVRGAKTADAVLATAMAIGKKIGKVAVVAGVSGEVAPPGPSTLMTIGAPAFGE